MVEAVQSVADEPLTDCECGAKGTLKKVIQPTAVMFKGSGFHINDYSAVTESATTETKSET